MFAGAYWNFNANKLADQVARLTSQLAISQANFLHYLIIYIQWQDNGSENAVTVVEMLQESEMIRYMLEK